MGSLTISLSFHNPSIVCAYACVWLLVCASDCAYVFADAYTNADAGVCLLRTQMCLCVCARMHFVFAGAGAFLLCVQLQVWL